MQLDLSKATLVKMSEDLWLPAEDLEQIQLALNTIELEDIMEANQIKTVIYRDELGTLKFKHQ